MNYPTTNSFYVKERRKGWVKGIGPGVIDNEERPKTAN